jgi:hypothetical protein
LATAHGGRQQRKRMLRRWASVAANKAELLQQQSAASSKCDQHRLAHAVTQWVLPDAAGRAVELRVRVAILQMANYHAALAWGRWSEAATRQAVWTQLLLTAIAWIVHRNCSRTWAAWVQLSARRAQEVSCARAARICMANHRSKRVWTSWLTLVQEFNDRLTAAVSRQRERRLWAILVAWNNYSKYVSHVLATAGKLNGKLPQRTSEHNKGIRMLLVSAGRPTRRKSRPEPFPNRHNETGPTTGAHSGAAR